MSTSTSSDGVLLSGVTDENRWCDLFSHMYIEVVGGALLTVDSSLQKNDLEESTYVDARAVLSVRLIGSVFSSSKISFSCRIEGDAWIKQKNFKLELVLYISGSCSMDKGDITEVNMLKLGVVKVEDTMAKPFLKYRVPTHYKGTSTLHSEKIVHCHILKWVVCLSWKFKLLYIWIRSGRRASWVIMSFPSFVYFDTNWFHRTTLVLATAAGHHLTTILMSLHSWTLGTTLGMVSIGFSILALPPSHTILPPEITTSFANMLWLSSASSLDSFGNSVSKLWGLWYSPTKSYNCTQIIILLVVRAPYITVTYDSPNASKWIKTKVVQPPKWQAYEDKEQHLHGFTDIRFEQLQIIIGSGSERCSSLTRLCFWAFCLLGFS